MRLPRPSRTVPRVAWAASSQWRAAPSTLAVLLAGLTCFGIGEGLLVQSRLGATPWTVLAQGCSLVTGLSIGTVTALLSSLVLCCWWPLHLRPGFGTLANLVVIALALQATVWLVAPLQNPAVQVVAMVGGLLAIGFGGALYLSCALGPGPRDGLMVGLQQRLGTTIARVRFGIEITVLTLGWLLGGTVGIGTALFAFGIGYVLAMFLSLLRHLAPQMG